MTKLPQGRHRFQAPIAFWFNQPSGGRGVHKANNQLGILMSKSQAVPPSPEAEAAEQSAKRLATTICRHVITVLGRPTDFLRITARQVTGDGFRVNVITGPDASCTRIAHSFFVTADGEGNIMGSAPAITKQY